MADQVLDGSLLERDGERELLASLVARASAGDGAVVVVEGQAGVGKTEILRAACELGEEHGLTVLRGRGSELDQAFAFGVVRQLLGREAANDPELLTGGAELAAPVLAPRGGELPGELLSSLEALQWLVVNLAERRPLLLMADDVHWADRPSLRWLVFLAERIEDVPVLLLAATRPAEPGADQELLDALATTPAAHMLQPAPLSIAAAAILVHRELPTAADPFVAACHRATGGNPFLLGELLRELAAEGAKGRADEAETVMDFGSERVGRAIRRRLRLLSDEATALARAIAVLGPRSPLPEAAGLAGIGDEEAAQAADALEAVAILAPGRDLDFAHPVVRAAVYAQIPGREAQALHAAAAARLVEGDADPEQVARHLLRLPASADAGRVEALRAAGREALSRGAADAAADYLRRALEEPPGPEERGAVLHELALVEALSRQNDAFPEHFGQAIEATSDPTARGEIALDFGRALGAIGRFHECIAAYRNGLDGLEDPDSPLAIALEAEMAGMANLDFTASDLAAKHVARRFAQLEAGEDLPPSLLVPLFWDIAVRRGPAEAAMDHAELIFGRSRLDELNSMLAGAGIYLILVGALTQAAQFFDAAMASSRRRGALSAVSWQGIMRSMASLRLGELRRAEGEARTAFELFSDDSTGEHGYLWTLAVLVEALIARGALAEADELLARRPWGAAPPSYPTAIALVARAEVHLGLGRAQLALRDAEEAGRLAAPTIVNPQACRWRAAAALALAALDRREEALAMATQELADARRFAFALADGEALRTLGLVTGGDEGVALLRESVAALERSESRLSHARSVLELGAALRRAGERGEAREVLRQAQDMLAHMGASGLADRAHEELVTAGARPRRERRMLSGRESLTASEDRVAALAAEGLTNREIAQRLFVTVKAVQWHLRNVYRKLDVASREELPEALGQGA